MVRRFQPGNSTRPVLRIVGRGCDAGGDKYDLFRVQDHFAIALRVTTLEARYRSMVEDQGYRVEQWRLQLDEWQRHQMFAWYIGVSQRCD